MSGKKEIIIVDQTTMIATTTVKEIGQILIGRSKGELLRILGVTGIMTNDVMTMMNVGMTVEMTVGMTAAMIIGMIAGMTAEMTAEMTAGMTIEIVVIAVIRNELMIGKGHRGHLGKKNQGLLKDPHLIMTTHSGIPNGKEWKCRKKLKHWRKEENISSMRKRTKRPKYWPKRKNGKENDHLLQKVWN